MDQAPDPDVITITHADHQRASAHVAAMLDLLMRARDLLGTLAGHCAPDPHATDHLGALAAIDSLLRQIEQRLTLFR